MLSSDTSVITRKSHLLYSQIRIPSQFLQNSMRCAFLTGIPTGKVEIHSIIYFTNFLMEKVDAIRILQELCPKFRVGILVGKADGLSYKRFLQVCEMFKNIPFCASSKPSGFEDGIKKISVPSTNFVILGSVP